MEIRFPELSIRSFGKPDEGADASVQEAKHTYSTMYNDNIPWSDEFSKTDELYDVLCYEGGIVPVIYDGKLYPICNLRSFEVDYDHVRNMIYLSAVLKGTDNVLRHYQGMLRYVVQDDETPIIVPFLIGDAEVCSCASESSSSDEGSGGSDSSSSGGGGCNEEDAVGSSGGGCVEEDVGGSSISCDCCQDDGCNCDDTPGGGGGVGMCFTCDCKCCVRDCPEESGSHCNTADVVESSSGSHGGGSDESSSSLSDESSSSLFDDNLFTKTIVLRDGTQIMFIAMSEKAFDSGFFQGGQFKKGNMASIVLSNGDMYSYRESGEEQRDLPQPFDRKLFFCVSKPSVDSNKKNDISIYGVPFLNRSGGSFSFLTNLNTIDLKFIENQNRLLISYKQFPDYVGIDGERIKYGLFNVVGGMLKLCSVGGEKPELVPLLFEVEVESANPMSSSSHSGGECGENDIGGSSSSISSFSSSRASSSVSSLSAVCNRNYVDGNGIAETGRCQPSMWKCTQNDAKDEGDTEYDPEKPTEGHYVKCCCPLYDKGDDPPTDKVGCDAKCDCKPGVLSSSSCWHVNQGHDWDVEREWLDGLDIPHLDAGDGIPTYGIPAVLELSNGISMVFYYMPVLSDKIEAEGGDDEETGNDIVRGNLYVIADEKTFDGSAVAIKDEKAWKEAEDKDKCVEEDIKTYHEDCDYYFNVLFWSILDHKTGKLSKGLPVPSLVHDESSTNGNDSKSECKMKFSIARRSFEELGIGPKIKLSYDKMTNVLEIDGAWGTIRQCGYDAAYGKDLGNQDGDSKPNFVPILFGTTIIDKKVNKKGVMLIYPEECEEENSWSSSYKRCKEWTSSFSCEEIVYGECCEEEDPGTGNKDPVVPTPPDPPPPGGGGQEDENPPSPDSQDFPTPCSVCDKPEKKGGGA